MSKYTVSVRKICENYARMGGGGLANVQQILNAATPKIFSFPYPIFDENYKNVLEQKILRHYYTREIGLETLGLWLLKLETSMTEIMPYYNQLYKSELLEFNPLYDVNVTEEHTTKSDGTQKSDGLTSGVTDATSAGNLSGAQSGTLTSTDAGTTTIGGKDLYSDTPQGSIQNIEDMSYLTNARLKDETNAHNNTQTSASDSQNTETIDNVSNQTAETTTKNLNTIHNIEDYVSKVTGKRGMHSYSALLNEFRQTFLNVDMLIVKDLSPLFFGLW